jgi:hypothetical protein
MTDTLLNPPPRPNLQATASGAALAVFLPPLAMTWSSLLSELRPKMRHPLAAPATLVMQSARLTCAPPSGCAARGLR